MKIKKIKLNKINILLLSYILFLIFVYWAICNIVAENFISQNDNIWYWVTTLGVTGFCFYAVCMVMCKNLELKGE